MFGQNNNYDSLIEENSKLPAGDAQSNSLNVDSIKSITVPPDSPRFDVGSSEVTPEPPLFMVDSLQSSIIYHFIEALRAEIPSSPTLVAKHQGMNNALSDLKNSVVRDGLITMSLNDMLKKKYNNDLSLVQYLQIQRGSVPPATLERILEKTRESFLQEHPASLMRHYSFLTQLLQVGPALSQDNRKKVDNFLTTISSLIKKFRTVLKALYPISNNRDLSSEDVLKNVHLLKNLKSTDEYDVQQLARLLAIFALDKLPQEGFANLGRDLRSWLLGDNDSAGATLLTDKESFLIKAANVLEKQESVRDHGGIGALRTALVEISAYQRGLQSSIKNKVLNTTTYESHDTKLNTIVFHMEACEQRYFAPSVLTAKTPQEVAPVGLELFLKDENDSDLITTINHEVKIDGKSASIRPITNLSSIWQATLALGVSGGSLITQKTLALMNLNEAEQLKKWSSELKNNTIIYNAQVNLALIKSIENKDEWFETLHLLNFKTEQEKRGFFRALLDFADSALCHLENEQAESSVTVSSESLIVKLYATVLECLNRSQIFMTNQANKAIESAAQEARLYLFKSPATGWLSLLRAELQKKNAQNKDMHQLGVQIKEIFDTQRGKGGNFRRLLSTVLSATFRWQEDQYYPFGEIIALAEAYEALLQRAQQFVPRVVEIYNSYSDDKGSTALQVIVKEGMFAGLAKSNPHSPFFPTAFQEASDANFYVQALFTFAHHPVQIPGLVGRNAIANSSILAKKAMIFIGNRPNSQAYSKEEINTRFLCYLIANTLNNAGEKIWKAFAANGFYGNLDACNALIEYYFNSDSHLDKATLDSILLIITFMLTHNSFQHCISDEVREKLSADVISVFAYLSKLEGENILEHPEINQLLTAISWLNTRKRLISNEECNKLKAIFKSMSKLDQNSPLKIACEQLWINAQQQKIVRRPIGNNRNSLGKRNDTTLLGLPMKYQPSEAGFNRMQEEARNKAIALVTRAEKNGANDPNPTSLMQRDIDTFNAQVKSVISLCFPEGYRYYKNTAEITRANKGNYKLTSSAQPRRDNLMQLCRDKLSGLLKQNTLTVDSLKEMINTLRNEVLQGSPETGEAKNVTFEINEPKPKALSAFTDEDFNKQPLVDLVEDINTAVTNLSAAPSLVQLARSQVEINSTIEGSAETKCLKDIEADEIAAVYDAIPWLLQNDGEIPESVVRVIAEITQDNIKLYKRALQTISSEQEFLYRVQLIRSSDLRQCVNRVLSATATSSDTREERKHDDIDHGCGDLHSFLSGLNNTSGYKEERDQFAWATAEYLINGNNEQLKKTGLLLLANNGYSWGNLIPLGFKYYFDLRQKSSPNKEDSARVIKALIKLVTSTNQSINESNQYSRSIQHYQRKLKALLLQVEKDNDPSREVEFYKLGNDFAKLPVDLAVHTYVDCWAHALMLRERDSSAGNNDKKAHVLAARLHQLRKDSPLFAQWHQKSLILGKNLHESFLYILVYGHSRVGLMHQSIAERTSKSNEFTLITAQDAAYCYRDHYHCKDQITQFAYEQHTEEAFRVILEKSTLSDISSGNTEMTLLEQVKMIFDAAKDWFASNLKSPYVNALYSIANATNAENRDSSLPEEIKQTSEAIIVELFAKACEGFNIMMHESGEKLYLVNAQTRVMPIKMKKMLQTTEKLRENYLIQSAKIAINSEKQAELILSLLATPLSSNRGQTPAASHVGLQKKVYTWIYAELEKARSESEFSLQFNKWLDLIAGDAELMQNYFNYVVGLSSSQFGFAATNKVQQQSSKLRVRHANLLLMRLNAFIEKNADKKNGLDNVVDYVVALWESCLKNGYTKKEIESFTNKNVIFFYDKYNKGYLWANAAANLPEVIVNAFKKFVELEEQSNHTEIQHLSLTKKQNHAESDDGSDASDDEYDESSTPNLKSSKESTNLSSQKVEEGTQHNEYEPMDNLRRSGNSELIFDVGASSEGKNTEQSWQDLLGSFDRKFADSCFLSEADRAAVETAINAARQAFIKTKKQSFFAATISYFGSSQSEQYSAEESFFNEFKERIAPKQDLVPYTFALYCLYAVNKENNIKDFEVKKLIRENFKYLDTYRNQLNSIKIKSKDGETTYGLADALLPKVVNNSSEYSIMTLVGEQLMKEIDKLEKDVEKINQSSSVTESQKNKLNASVRKISDLLPENSIQSPFKDGKTFQARMSAIETKLSKEEQEQNIELSTVAQKLFS